MDDGTRRAAERLDRLSERIKLASTIIGGLLVGALVWLAIMYYLWYGSDIPKE